jgi:hypothetical protein
MSVRQRAMAREARKRLFNLRMTSRVRQELAALQSPPERNISRLASSHSAVESRTLIARSVGSRKFLRLIY